MKKFKGLPASKGVAIGKAFVYQGEEPRVVSNFIEDVEGELTRLEQALKTSREQLEKIRAKAQAEAGEEAAEIFDAHILILEDPVFLEGVKVKIAEQKINAETAITEVVREYASLLASLESEYMKARAADVEDVGKRIIRNLIGVEETSLGNLLEPVIVIAQDLAPSDTAKMPKDKVLAFCTARGTLTSHTAILARALGIPAVVGLGDEVVESIKTGDLLIVDGEEGVVLLAPAPQDLEKYRERQKHLEVARSEEKLFAWKEARTQDGYRIEVAANIGDVESAKLAIEYGAEGVGLLRTEFLYLERSTPPTEDEQYSAYCAIAEALEGRTLIIRTLDIGGDKPVPYLKMAQEGNPFLGCRGIRLSLKETWLLETQLRAILRAAYQHNIKVMFPMVADVSEVRRVKELMAEIRNELEKSGIPYAEEIEVGIMVETPAAALAADILADEVDFFSIGSNDLIQYTMACDRTNEALSYLYQPLHPVILRLIKWIIEAAHIKGKWVGICGEMGGEPKCIPILVGLGIDELSMQPAAIPTAKRIIGAITLPEARGLAEKALSFSTPEEVSNLVSSWLRERLKI
jgi:phosphotransferase system enzyme I (PtsI)